MMNLHGVDVFIWSPSTPDLPKTIGKFALRLISNRGTKIYPGPAPEIDLLDWPRCRFVSDEEVEDSDIDALANEITRLGYRWTKLQKLFRKDGVDQFSEPY
jgi:hypothetical protein